MIKTTNTGFFERTSIKLTRLIGSPVSLVLHTIAFGGFFILRKGGFITDSAFLLLTAIICLEAMYMVIFVQMIVARTAKNLTAAEETIAGIKEEENETYKLMVQILHLAHQMKTIQYKKPNGNSHRIHA